MLSYEEELKKNKQEEKNLLIQKEKLLDRIFYLYFTCYFSLASPLFPDIHRDVARELIIQFYSSFSQREGRYEPDFLLNNVFVGQNLEDLKKLDYEKKLT